jgi:hypothetical protein
LEVDYISKNTCSCGVVASSCALDHQRRVLIASAVYLHLTTTQNAFVNSQNRNNQMIGCFRNRKVFFQSEIVLVKTITLYGTKRKHYSVNSETNTM